jgi:pentatricopeptide repeat protein
MFKQIFNQSNHVILSNLSSNFKFTKNYFSSFRYFTRNVIYKNHMNDNDLFLQKNQYMIKGIRFQSTTINQQPQSLEMIIDQNKEALLLNKSEINNDSTNKIFEKSNFIANESSNNEKEILSEIDLMDKEKDILDNNQQILLKSMSFANEKTSLESLNYSKDIFSLDTDVLIPQVQENFSDKETSLESSDSKDAKKGVEIDISTKEQLYHPIIQTEGRNIDDLWNDYKNLNQEQFKTLTVKDFNLIIETFRKYLKHSDVSDKPLIYSKIISVFEDLEKKAKLTPDVNTYNIFMSTALNLDDLSNLCNLFKVMKNREIQPNTVSYNIMMSGFAKFGSRQNIYALYKEMIDLGIKRNKITYTMLISSRARDKHFIGALRYYRMMLEDDIKPDVQIYNSLLNALIYDADGNQIIKTYEEMKSQGIKPTVLTYNSLIRAMILRGEKERAEKYFHEMESEGIKPNVLILDSLGITGLDAFQKLQDSNCTNLNLLDYNTLLSGCLRKSKYDDAIKIFNFMRENEIYPSIATYTILTGAYLQNNETEKAIELFNRMKEDNVSPDSQIFTFMIDSLLKQKNINETYNFLSEITNSENEIKFKKSEVNRLLDSASKLEDSKVIEKLFHTISNTESQLSNIAFEKILWRVAQDNDFEEKIDYYLKYMGKCNIPIRNTTYGSIIEGFIQKEDYKNSTYWYKCMINNRFIPTGKTIFKMMQFFSKKDNLNNVLKYWNDFNNYGIKPEKDDFNFIIDYCCKSGKDYTVSDIFSQCRKMGFNPTNGTLLKIMQFYFNKSKVTKVIEYWDLFYVLKIHPRLDVINFMVDFCCTLKSKRLVSQILSQCKDAGYDAYSLYRLKKSNKGPDDINALLLKMENTYNESSETNLYEKNLKVIEHWINLKEKNHNSLSNINKKLNLTEIQRLRRVLNIEEIAIRRREKLTDSLQKNKCRLDPSTQKSINSWTPYKKHVKSKDLSNNSKDDVDSNIEENVENVDPTDIISDNNELLVDSIIETTFKNVTEQNVME